MELDCFGIFMFIYFIKIRIYIFFYVKVCELYGVSSFDGKIERFI